jgi:hypothetical protein
MISTEKKRREKRETNKQRQRWLKKGNAKIFEIPELHRASCCVLYVFKKKILSDLFFSYASMYA